MMADGGRRTEREVEADGCATLLSRRPPSPVRRAPASRPLQVPPPLARRHRLVELLLFGAGEMDEVLDDIGAEGVTEELRRFEFGDRLRQAVRHARQIGG